jgi:hypothetical protein
LEGDGENGRTNGDHDYSCIFDRTAKKQRESSLGGQQNPGGDNSSLGTRKCGAFVLFKLLWKSAARKCSIYGSIKDDTIKSVISQKHGAQKHGT